MDLSCIIVNYKNSESLKCCLDSIYQTIQEIEFEIIIIDNSGKDSGLQSIEENYPKVQIINNPTNVGFSKANNQAAKIALGEFLLFLNPDTILKKQTINSMFKYICSHWGIGTLGPKVLNPDGSLQYSCRRYPTLWTGLFNHYSILSRLFPQNSFTSQYLMLDFDHNETSQVDWLSGCCLMVPKIVFEGVNGFDENYFLFNEDIDLCRMVRKTGKEIIYFPEAKVVHKISTSNRKTTAKVIIQRHLGMMYYFKKHHSKNLLIRGVVNFLISFRGIFQLFTNLAK